MASVKLSELAHRCGIIGAGGAGFPLSIKLSARADTFILNGAECEPLIGKDHYLLKTFTREIIGGVKMAMEAVGAKRGIIGIKESHPDLIKLFKSVVSGKVEVAALRDTYPSGDEFLLTYDTTGRSIPKGGIPLDVAVVVCNVETIYNLCKESPVVEKVISISGDIPEPIILTVPVGTLLSDIFIGLNIKYDGKKALVGGAMMGFTTDDFEIPVTKTTGGIILLFKEHPIFKMKDRTDLIVAKIAYTCDQCMRCTDLCPRDLLGNGVKPNLAMMSVSTGPLDKIRWQETSLYCCECGLCSLYACPEDLDPFRVMRTSKRELLSHGAKIKKEKVTPHPMYDYRRVPTEILIQRLGFIPYKKTFESNKSLECGKEIIIPLKQGVHSPCNPIVKAGGNVRKNDLIGDEGEGRITTLIHSSIDGIIKEITEDKIVITKSRKE